MIITSLISTRGSFCGYAIFTAANFITSHHFPIQSQLEPSTSNIEGLPVVDSDSTIQASQMVRKYISSEIESDPTLAGPILRLAFHDAATLEESNDKTTKQNKKRNNNNNYEQQVSTSTTTTGGSNGSIRYELEWSENRALQRPLTVIERIHSQIINTPLLSTETPTISLADTIALAGATAIESAGGPHISIRLGRIDVSQADARHRRHPMKNQTERSIVDRTLPSPGLDSDGLRLFFAGLGLSEEEFVALCGAHDLGRHVTLLDMPKDCLRNLTRACLEEAPVSMPFVTRDPDTLSNTYFKSLLRWNDRNVESGEVAFIPTDVALVVDVGLRRYVELFAGDEEMFFRVFARAYRKLVDATATSRGRY